MACETATKTNMVMIFGEITTSAKVDYEKVVRDTCRAVGFTSDDVGLDCDKCKVWQPPASRLVCFPRPAGLCGCCGRTGKQALLSVKQHVAGHQHMRMVDCNCVPSRAAGKQLVPRLCTAAKPLELCVPKVPSSRRLKICRP